MKLDEKVRADHLCPGDTIRCNGVVHVLTRVDVSELTQRVCLVDGVTGWSHWTDSETAWPTKRGGEA